MSSPPPILDAFSLDAVLLEMRATTKVECLDELVTHMVASKQLPKPRRQQVFDALVERESRGSTGFGRGVAAPHAKIAGLRRPAAVIGRSATGLDFKAVDGEPVHVFVLLVSPENRADEHLATLRWISHIARDPDFLSFILQASTPAAVLEVLTERAP
ncbi:MAG: PTS sugar transporter subunit IIA [Planctomycetes bacterium]|nr:PTS sugar transporter subunit IIA [Planctomycetota bacterium]